MGIAGAVGVGIGLFVAALAAVRRGRRRPLVLAAPLALALVVVLEALLLDLLSVLHAVTGPALYAAHLSVIVAVAAVAWRGGARPATALGWLRRGATTVARLGWPVLLVVPVAALVTLSALRYAPNNWDSMTYRLARVAYWLQQRSVEPYPTHIPRQVVMQPGAEYVLASFQAMAGSDALASLLQLGAWLLVVLASPALARLAGAPRRLAPWAAVVVAALPMGVLQASSTQGDLVAAALTLAVVAATAPFLHRTPRWRPADAALLGLALAAAGLVKVTAVVAAGPFLVFALVRVLLATPRRPRALALAVGVAALVAFVPLAPELARRTRPELAKSLAGFAASYTYPGVAELPDRFLNLGRGLVRHVPSPPALVAAVGIEGWCRPGEELCSGLLLRPHEDNAGNPLHVLLVLLAAGVAVARRHRLPARTPAFLAAVAGAWVLFHFAFRDNTWIARLETPTYVLVGLGVAAWGSRRQPPAEGGAARKRKGTPEGRSPAPQRALVATAVAALACLAFGARTALDNESRPPLPSDGRVAELGYYANQPNLGRAHDAVLRAAAAARCDRLGLLIGADSYDYPLAWRAMQQGITVHHVFGADPWPCLLFTDQRQTPEAVEAMGWARTSLPFVYLNRAGGAASPAPAAHGG